MKKSALLLLVVLAGCDTPNGTLVVQVRTDLTPGTGFVSVSTTTMTPSGVLAYTARADLQHVADLRLGLKGTAKIFGPRRPLAVWLLRKPLAYIRHLLA